MQDTSQILEKLKSLENWYKAGFVHGNILVIKMDEVLVQRYKEVFRAAKERCIRKAGEFADTLCKDEDIENQIVAWLKLLVSAWLQGQAQLFG